MHLKRLEIQGFKSFANKTVLDFLPLKNGRHSITAIVGPNGAGKSNVTDAIRWVMGETSIKNLRGKKSEDVIFSGSEQKGAIGAAEVTMVLDNSTVIANPHPALSTVVERVRGLPSAAAEGDGGGMEMLDYPEITITRRLYRSGESEYLVNNNSVRLIDLHLLLARARFAEHAYSIISQGMIDRLLTVSPSERKDFFDEASGIKEYQIKQHQASLKLARTQVNMAQAEALITEVEPRLRILSRQVKKLERRQEVEAELTASQEQYYFTLYTKNKQELDEIKKQLSLVDNEYRVVFKVLENTQQELADLARGTTRQEIFEELRGRHQAAARVKNELERQMAIIEGTLQTEYRQAGAHNVRWLENKVTETRNALEGLRAASAAAVAVVEQAGRLVTEQKKLINNLAIEQTQLKLKISRLQNELIKGQSEQNYLQFSGLTAVKAVLDAKNKFGKVHGLVAELGEVTSEYATALEVAAGAHLTSIVVEDESVARGCIEYLRAERYGVATFMPLNKIMPRATKGEVEFLLREPGVIGKAIDLIRFNQRFANIFSFILGETLVVEDLRVAERIGSQRARLVTLAGDLVERTGVYKGGYRGKKHGIGFSSRLSFNEEDSINELQVQIVSEGNNLLELDQNSEKLKTKLLELLGQEQAAAHEQNLTAKDCLAKEQELEKLSEELRLTGIGPEEYSVRLKKLAQDKKDLTQKISVSSSQVNILEKDIEQFNRQEEEKKQRMFALQQNMQNQQNQINSIVSRRNELNIQLAKIETKQEDLGEEVYNDLKVSFQSLVERVSLPVAFDQLEILSNNIQKLKYQLSLIGGIDEEVAAEYSTTKERYEFLTSQIKDLRLATNDLTKMIVELNELMKKKRSVAFKKIRKEFDRYFKILFEGGKADLEEVYGVENMEEEAVEGGDAANKPSLEGGGEGVLAGTGSPSFQEGAGGVAEASKKSQEKILTGIEVIASPPGKKVKYLSMLSGGERTLTSIALICAILYTNPSPFVVLDEVEAALDETNTLRFVKIMTELSSQSQFIIVTHNRVTMHAANALYGVVMGADGVSKLLSVKIEDAPKFEDSQAGVDKS